MASAMPIERGYNACQLIVPENEETARPGSDAVGFDLIGSGHAVLHDSQGRSSGNIDSHRCRHARGAFDTGDLDHIIEDIQGDRSGCGPNDTGTGEDLESRLNGRRRGQSENGRSTMQRHASRVHVERGIAVEPDLDTVVELERREFASPCRMVRKQRDAVGQEPEHSTGIDHRSRAGQTSGSNEDTSARYGKPVPSLRCADVFRNRPMRNPPELQLLAIGALVRRAFPTPTCERAPLIRAQLSETFAQDDRSDVLSQPGDQGIVSGACHLVFLRNLRHTNGLLSPYPSHFARNEISAQWSTARLISISTVRFDKLYRAAIWVELSPSKAAATNMSRRRLGSCAIADFMASISLLAIASASGVGDASGMLSLRGTASPSQRTTDRRAKSMARLRAIRQRNRCGALPARPGYRESRIQASCARSSPEAAQPLRALKNRFRRGSSAVKVSNNA